MTRITAKGSRATYDLPPDLINLLARRAENLSISASQLAALAIRQLLDRDASGEIDLYDYLKPTKIPRYSYRVSLEKIRN